MAMLDSAFRGYGVPGGLPPALRDAVIATPRHRFVHRFRIGDGPLRDADDDPDANLADIYSDAVMRHVDADGALLDSSNSQPSYVLYLLHLLGIEAGQSVLEIGSGSGWLAAVMARLGGRVVGIELIPDLAERSRADLARCGIDTVAIVTGDGANGFEAAAPYDRAMITAAAWDVPAVLIDQVAAGGRVLVPVELRGGQGCDVTVLRRQEDGLVAERSVPGFFVPLKGGHQDKRDAPFSPEAAGAPIARHALPLGVGSWAPAADLFRGYLSRTEPGFVSADPAASWADRRPSTAPFGLREGDAAALWQQGEIVSYGDLTAARRLAQAYADWARLGLPGRSAFHLEIRRAEPAARTDALGTELRGETMLLWRIPEPAASWRELI